MNNLLSFGELVRLVANIDCKQKIFGNGADWAGIVALYPTCERKEIPAGIKLISIDLRWTHCERWNDGLYRENGVRREKGLDIGR